MKKISQNLNLDHSNLLEFLKLTKLIMNYLEES